MEKFDEQIVRKSVPLSASVLHLDKKLLINRDVIIGICTAMLLRYSKMSLVQRILSVMDTVEKSSVSMPL